MADDPELKRARDIERRSLEERWLEENRSAIDSYNKRVAEDGILSDEIGLLADPR